MGDPFIENFSLSVSKGKTVALVGGIGSGKSILGKLVAGLYQPWSGKIRYDKKEIFEHSRETMKISLAHVDQEIFLFGGTIRENLTLWDHAIDDKIVVEAAKIACIHDDIIGRGGGYEFKLIEGGYNFSHGQRQRLEIARALLYKPSILIFDEATSALDSVTEAKILKNIRDLGCTCLFIAHRLSTIKNCDEILVLDNGTVVQRGKHDELKEKDGAYKSLLQIEEHANG